MTGPSKYYQIDDNAYYPERWRLDLIESDNEDISDYDFVRCRRFEKKGRIWTSVFQVGVSLDYCIAGVAVPLVSRTLGSLIQSMVGSDIQLIDIDIINSEEPDYLILNVLRRESCMDKHRSRFDYYPDDYEDEELAGKVGTMEKFVIDPERANGAHLFYEADHPVLVCSDVLRELIERSGLRGPMFLSEIGEPLASGQDC